MKIEVLGCSGAEFPGHHPTGFLVDGRVLFDAGTLNHVLDEKRQLKIENLPERIYITHMKPQFYKTIQKELTRLDLKNLQLLKEGETLEV